MRRVAHMVGTREFTMLRAEQFMENAVQYHHVDDKGDKLAETMTEGGFGSVPIVAADGSLMGIVTEYDLLRQIVKGNELAMVTAKDIMTTPITVTEDASAMDIIYLLQGCHLIRMPVVNADNRLIGVVARRDILEGYLKATTPVRGF